MQLRPYQQDAVDSAVAWMRKSTEPALFRVSHWCRQVMDSRRHSLMDNQKQVKRF